MTIITQPLPRLFFITGFHSSNQTAVYQINHLGDSTPKRHYNLLLENLSKVTSHDSLTHLNNNTLTQPLKLSKILFFRKYKIQPNAKNFFDLVFSIPLQQKSWSKDQNFAQRAKSPAATHILPPMLVSCPPVPLLRQITPNFLRTNWNISTFCSNIFNIYALF